jgi:TPR repeat protein
MKDAAERGNQQAQVNLGSMYRDGQGTPQNYGEAM